MHRARGAKADAKNIIHTALCSVPRIPIHLSICSSVHLFICSSVHLFIWIGRKPPGKTGFVQ